MGTIPRLKTPKMKTKTKRMEIFEVINNKKRVALGTFSECVSYIIKQRDQMNFDIFPVR